MDCTSNITTFTFKSQEVRTVILENQPWFVAKDVCNVLEISNSRDAVYSLDDEEKGVAFTDTLGGKQEMSVVSESGLYALIFKSRKPEAKAFRKWVTSEILPTIRKHGGYLTPEKVEEALTDPDTIIRLATNLKEERAKRKELEALREAERPKVLFADSVSASETDILVGDLAKILKQNGIDIGQNRLFEFLRREGYLCRKQGDMWNMPTQTAMNIGLFKIMETTFIRNGKTFVTKTVKVTGRGQVYFVNLFLRRAKEEAEKAAAAQLQLVQN